jgi:UDP-galactopyranose mutase
MREYDYLVVGAGLFGSVLAERLANESQRSVLVIDKRSHLGGLCGSALCVDTDIEFHRYGTHIFHTSDQEVWDYISRFVELNEYRHKVLSHVRGEMFDFPLTLNGINKFFKSDYTLEEAKEFLDSVAIEMDSPENFEQRALSVYGRDLYEAFIKGYTRKQWGLDPRELPSSVVNRLVFDIGSSYQYFNRAKWQGVPVEGYDAFFQKLLNSPNIEVQLNTSFSEIQSSVKARLKTIYTGPIDRYFNFIYGKLSWRSLYFKPHVLERSKFQDAAVVNYPDQMVAHTRIHEPRHLHPERSYTDKSTLVIREYPCDNPEEPYYPVCDARSISLFESYKKLATKEEDVLFRGRLGEYRYLDMDESFKNALKFFQMLEES